MVQPISKWVVATGTQIHFKFNIRLLWLWNDHLQLQGFLRRVTNSQFSSPYLLRGQVLSLHQVYLYSLSFLCSSLHRTWSGSLSLQNALRDASQQLFTSWDSLSRPIFHLTPGASDFAVLLNSYFSGFPHWCSLVKTEKTHTEYHKCFCFTQK